MKAREAVLFALSSRGCNPKQNGTGWQARCPAHEDREPSLSISNGGGKVLLFCHAGCSLESVVAALGLNIGDLFDEGVPEQVRSRIVTTYGYTDENGTLLYEVVRFAPKNFRQRRPDGSGGWFWKLDDTRRVLYRLPEVLAVAQEQGTVYICEGEKDADAVLEWVDENADALPITATTNPGGAGKWREEYTNALKGAHVIVVADRDEPGRAHARAVYASVRPVASTCRVVEAAMGKDLSDHIAAGLTLGQLVDVTLDVQCAAKSNDVPTPAAFRIEMLDLAAMLSSPPEPIPWILPGYLARRESAVLGGHAGHGKTITATDLALAAATGGKAFDSRQIEGGPYRVGIFDEEQALPLIAHRFRVQCAGRGISVADIARLPLFYVHQQGFDLTRDDHRDALLRFVETNKLDIVILDSLIRFAGRLNTRDEGDMAHLFSRVLPLTRDLGCSVLWLSHLRKPNAMQGGDENDRQHALRGSTDIPAAVAEVFILEKLASGARTLYHTKTRWQEAQPPLGLDFDFNEAQQALKVVATGTVADAETTILNVLADSGRDGMLRASLVAALEDAGSRDAARLFSKQAGRLHARGRIYRRQEGRQVRYWQRDSAPAEVLAAESALRDEGMTRERRRERP